MDWRARHNSYVIPAPLRNVSCLCAYAYKRIFFVFFSVFLREWIGEHGITVMLFPLFLAMFHVYALMLISAFFLSFFQLICVNGLESTA